MFSYFGQWPRLRQNGSCWKTTKVSLLVIAELVHEFLYNDIESSLWCETLFSTWAIKQGYITLLFHRKQHSILTSLFCVVVSGKFLLEMRLAPCLAGGRSRVTRNSTRRPTQVRGTLCNTVMKIYNLMFVCVHTVLWGATCVIRYWKSTICLCVYIQYCEGYPV